MAEKPYPSPSNLTEQLLNLCWRLATEMRAVYNTVKTKISKDEADAAYLAIKGKAVSASSADTATKATQDASGNVITSTYAKKSEVPTVMTGASSSAAGKAGTVPAPAAGNQGKYLRGDGTWQTPPDTTYSTMKGASSSSAGSTGLVPTPSAGSQEKFLRGDGTWQAQVNADWNATSGYGVINNKPAIPTVDSSLSTSSTNAIANNAVTNALNGKMAAEPAQIEFKNMGSSVGHGGYIDFHYNNSSADYTSRIIEDASGKLSLTATNGVYINGVKAATTANIPTRTSQLTNNSGFVKVTSGTSDLTAGSSSLTTGQVYLVYE